MDKLIKLNERLAKIERVVDALYLESKKSKNKDKSEDWKMPKAKNPKAHLGETKVKDTEEEEEKPTKSKIQRPGGSKFHLKPKSKIGESADTILDREISELLEKKKAGKTSLNKGLKRTDKVGSYKSPFGDSTKGEKSYKPALKGIKQKGGKVMSVGSLNKGLKR